MNAIHDDEITMPQSISPWEPASGRMASGPQAPIFQGFLAAFFTALRDRISDEGVE